MDEILFFELPFEERCQMAIDYLRGNMADYKSASLETPLAIQKILELKPDDSSVIVELKQEMLRDETTFRKECEEKLAAAAWKSCICFSNTLFEVDATDFATKVIQREGNKSAN